MTEAAQASGHAAQVGAAVATVFRNRELRRVELAFAGFNCAEWGVWIAILVYAYGQGGATTAGLVALAQLLPAGLFAPFAATLADRRSAARILVLGYAAQAVAMAATAAALFASAPPLVIYALAAVAATAITVTRPTQAALTPALARTPRELTATNVVSGLVESTSVLAAPALVGVLLAVGSPAVAVAAMAAFALAAVVLAAGLPGRAPIGSGEDSPLADALAAFRLLARDPESRVLVALLGLQYVAIGALDVLFVVLAIGVLDLGGSGAGYLNAAFGAGGVAGIAVTAALIDGKRLAGPLIAAVGLWSAAFAVIGLRPSAVGAFLLLGAAGAARSLFDVAGRTLLQRTAQTEALARVFGVLEALSMAGLAAGSLLAPALIGLGGARAAFLGVGAVLPAAAVVFGRRLARIDRRATIPVVEIALLRSLPMFGALGSVELEGLARSLEPVSVVGGTTIIRAGEIGDRFYMVGDGEVEVSAPGVDAKLGRGQGFGEIALLKDVARTATVVACTDALLYALAKAPFLAAVTGSAESARLAERMVDERLAEHASPPSARSAS